VLTHKAPDRVPKGTTTFTFVTDGIESAVKQAKAAAGGKTVGVMGANTAKQCIEAGRWGSIIRPSRHTLS
jgi:dihydrofolate reductase